VRIAGRLRREGFDVSVPALDRGDFEGLTVTRMLGIVEAEAGSERVHLIGSSLGGYLAALFGQRERARVGRMVLLAPAFGFLDRWPGMLGPEATSEWERTGFREVFHYGTGQMARIGWELVRDGRQYPGMPLFEGPTLIVHGVRDDDVPIEVSRQYVERSLDARLVELESGHELTDQLDGLEAMTAEFLKADASSNDLDTIRGSGHP
jgi:pimeloyl-ACP methyl ester carboxylesterase